MNQFGDFKKGSKSRRSIPLVTCGHCNGAGKVHLRADMQLTLDAVEYHGEAEVREVATALLWHGNQTAINNRLEALRRDGLLDRRRRGRYWVYRLTKLDEL